MILRTDIEPFFGDRVDRALEQLGRPVGPGPQIYLVGLMVDYVSEVPDLDALCLKLGYFRPDRIVVLKSVGDSALFLSGFFPEWVERHGLRADYYASIGSVAYSELASKFPRPHREVFEELADCFSALQSTLGVVREGLEGPVMDQVASGVQGLGASPGDLTALLRRLG